MPRQQAGALYLADERGAHEPDPPRPSATCPLFEAAATHDGQPADAWLRMFYRVYGWPD